MGQASTGTIYFRFRSRFFLSQRDWGTHAARPNPDIRRRKGTAFPGRAVLLLWRGRTYSTSVSSKRADSVGETRRLLSQRKSSEASGMFSVSAQISLNNTTRAVSVFIDSGADTEFLDIGLAQKLSLPTRATSKTVKVLALDVHVLHHIT